MEEGDKPVTMSREMRAQWETPQYLNYGRSQHDGVFTDDEAEQKLVPRQDFESRRNIRRDQRHFIGDLLQLPCVSTNRVYKSQPRSQQGPHLWTSVNIVVILTEQVR